MQISFGEWVFNMNLYGELLETGKLSQENIKTMYSLMDEFYDDMTFSAFIKDLAEKDYCILLFDESGSVKGFSTQKIMSVKVQNEDIYGVFSGDTIIHKDYWGSLELYKVFSQYFFEYGRKYKEFYWFLISKGYKTYKILPVFFNCFYPNVKEETPDYEQSIMHAFGSMKFPNEYDAKSGVIRYTGIKDKLKAGIADITEKQKKDKNVDFFLKANPDFLKGNDLVCLTKLSDDNLKNIAKRLLLGK